MGDSWSGREDVRYALEKSLRFALLQLDPAQLVRPHLPQQAPTLIVAVGKAALTMLDAAVQAFPETEWLAVPPAAQVAELSAALPDDESDVKSTELSAASSVASLVASSAESSNESSDRRGLPKWAFGPDARGRIVPGTHPLPTDKSVEAGHAVLEAIGALTKDDLLLLLLSGGGSSLLCAPDGVSLEEKRQVAADLMAAGANIFELNAVRKHLSLVKGGRLAAATKARVLNLVVSDVLGDDLSVIASGPATPDDSTFTDAVQVLYRYSVQASSVRQHFARGLNGQVAEAPGADSPVWQRVESRVIGSNHLFLDAAKQYWQSLGYNAVILSDRFDGEAKDVAEVHAAIVGAALSNNLDRLLGLRLPAETDTRRLVKELGEAISEWAEQPSADQYGPEQTGTEQPGPEQNGAAQQARPLVLLSGGEATVTVKGSGQGGRNQEFALWLLKMLNEGTNDVSRVWAISAGSDGIDGNSPAAGALITPDAADRAKELGLETVDYLSRNDSFTFFNALGNSVITGHTGNNLNDYRAIVIQPPSR